MKTAFRLITAGLGLLAASTLAAGPALAGAPGHDFGKLNSEAPPEAGQFAFIVGKWDCTTKFMKPEAATTRP